MAGGWVRLAADEDEPDPCADLGRFGRGYARVRTGAKKDRRQSGHSKMQDKQDRCDRGKPSVRLVQLVDEFTSVPGCEDESEAEH